MNSGRITGGRSLTTHTPYQERRYLAVLIVSMSLFAGIYPLLAGSAYSGNPDLHSALETIGSVFAIIAGISLVVRFYALGNRLYLFIGLAFFINGGVDFVHGLMSFRNLFGLPASSLAQFIPGTYVTGRLMLGVLLAIAPFMPRLLGPSRDPRRETMWVSLVVIFATMALTALAFYVPLPKFIFPERLISRPVDLLSAAVLLCAMGSFLYEYHRERDLLAWCICFSIGMNIVGQAMMSVSKSLYDPFFDIAHVYKIIGYIIPLIGFSLYQIAVITGRKRAEDKLRLAARTFENTIESIIITDKDTKILQVNDAFTRITGYRADEAIGRTPQMLSSGLHDKQFYHDMWKSINETGVWQGEVWDRRKSGEVFVGLLTISAIKDENGEVTNYVGIFYDITEKKRAEDRIQHLAYYDALTDLPNRSLFYDRLGHALTHARRYRQLVAVMFFDLDDFKIINDTLGHRLGDTLIKSVAERLKKHLRKDNTLSRQGGDEFTIILTDITRPEDAAVVAERIRRVLSEPFNLDGNEVFVTASTGICIFPDDGEDIQALMKNADTAMYHAKGRGKDNFQFFAPEMNASVNEKLRLSTTLRHALAKKEFVLHYQPQVDLKTGRIIGHEALIRWQHPELGLVPPADFIPVAEETGLIVQISEWVLGVACKQTKAWHEAGFFPLYTSINISSLHFRQRKVEETIIQVLKDTGLHPGSLEIEITESILMENVEFTIRTLNNLKAAGIKISVDDFGTGYSSLYYLKRYPIDKLKIDQSFINDCTTNPDDASIVKAIVALAHNLNIKVIAEGVETAEQLRFLHEHRCDEIQGFYFSRGLPVEEFKKLLKEGKKLKRIVSRAS